MKKILATVKITDYGRIPLTKRVLSRLEANVGDHVKIVEREDGSIGLAKVEA
jgi:bifunctional DNA-binding transcriptional regulator/antitoxin component of YhaV-PrlF toxin-antitoxin module